MAVSKLADHECVALFRRGEREGFAELARRYRGRLFRFLVRMTGCPDDAEELTQDTLERALHGIADWEPRAQFQTWLFRIATNAAYDHLRQRRRMGLVPLDTVPEAHDPDAGPERRLRNEQEAAILRSALMRLPFEHRQILLLREAAGLSYAEIAATLGVNEGTVKSRLARARLQVIDLCKRYGLTRLNTEDCT